MPQPTPSVLKFPAYFFGVVVPTVFGASFGNQRMDLDFDISSGIYTFHLLGKELKSDSAEELVEIAIREIEKVVTSMINVNLDLRPYCTFSLTCDEDGPAIEFYDAFTVLERPYRIELYTDTFRRGVHRLRELRAG
jgi:hypothetical protein